MKEKFFRLLREQIRQGASPKKIALTIAFGLSLGVFPILGSTTLLCLLFAWALKLNQPTIHFVNYLLYPVQILLIPVFIKAGSWFFDGKAAPFSVSKAADVFTKSPGLFLHKFGLLALYGMAAWTIVAVPFIAGTYYLVLPRLSGLKGERPS